MTEPTKRAWATIDLNALRKNLARVRALCPESKIIPVIKSNAYGHGMEQTARALKDSHTRITAFAVATLTEALELKQLDLESPILLLNGFIGAEELALCLEAGIEPVIHSPYQIELLEAQFATEIFGDKRKLWLKHNSGMNRLGMTAESCVEAYTKLHKYPGTEFVLMTHLGYADDMNDPDSREFTARQMEEFNVVHKKVLAARQEPAPCSVAASAGILTLPDTHLDFVRPGVMLYGSSPLANETGEEIGLQPVMTLSSRLIAIHDLSAGDAVGYNASYVCDRDTRVGVVSIGYGDGYPRSAGNGTPVLIKTRLGSIRTRLIGRVSMDMITVDLSGIEAVSINDEVVLWGSGLCVDEVAHAAQTIAYELFCKVTRRVDFDYL
ncbi:MAG: alanine racemase [Gammaproteobacteria bacterium]|jgi:alanine racemase|nr:alanine racemase [Gammaproteobacteria bacterium]